MTKVRSLESVPFSRYLCLSNVLRIRAIPTYRVYRLYDSQGHRKALYLILEWRPVTQLRYNLFKSTSYEKNILATIKLAEIIGHSPVPRRTFLCGNRYHNHHRRPAHPVWPSLIECTQAGPSLSAEVVSFEPRRS